MTVDTLYREGAVLMIQIDKVQRNINIFFILPFALVLSKTFMLSLSFFPLLAKISFSMCPSQQVVRCLSGCLAVFLNASWPAFIS